MKVKPVSFPFKILSLVFIPQLSLLIKWKLRCCDKIWKLLRIGIFGCPLPQGFWVVVGLGAEAIAGTESLGARFGQHT
jgi:hypothetical protein